MTRAAEAAVLASAVLLAGLGTTLVDLAVHAGITTRVPIAVAGTAAGLGIIHLAMRRWVPRANPFLVPAMSLLVVLGVIEIGRIDEGLGTGQLRWLLIAGAVAAAVMWLLRRTGTGILRRFRYSILMAGIILFALPLLPSSWPIGGAEVGGARLWTRVQIGSLDVTFQPGEMARLAVIIFLASYLTDRHRGLRKMSRSWGPVRIPEPRQLLPLAVAWLAAAGILIYQRDLGAALLLFGVFVAMLYAATDRAAYAGAGAGFILAGGGIAYLAFSHVEARVTGWLRPFDDYLGSGFQVAQGLFALGSGSLAGSGLGVGRPELMPAAHTDLIFAAIAEELGYLGAVALLTGFAVLVAAAFGVALRAADLHRKLLAAGLAAGIAIQVLLIVGGIVRLVPLTGVTLPFVSYGGSSLMAAVLSVALLAVISHEEAR